MMRTTLLASFLLLLLSGCWSRRGEEVVAYTALDAEFSQAVFDEFTRETGIHVAAKYDVESTKTIGLYQALVAEAPRPRADVFWNNEILNTLRLDRAGLLAAYASPAGEQLPAMYRSPRHTWYGFAARARVLIVNRELVPQGDEPRSIEDLANPKWKGRAGIAKPLFGTTATHIACLFAYLGADRAEALLQRMKQNEIQIVEGNKQVAISVAAKRLAFGLTDTDDAIGELEQGYAVKIVYPDQHRGGMGTLFIPNTVAILRGAPHPQAARRLVDYLLSPAVEARLAQGPSAQIPLNPQVRVLPRVETPRTVRAMEVDFNHAAEQWERAARFVRDHFTGP
jgi:iron(III) transport system substrate-binding protein